MTLVLKGKEVTSVRLIPLIVFHDDSDPEDNEPEESKFDEPDKNLEALRSHEYPYDADFFYESDEPMGIHFDDVDDIPYQEHI